MIATILSEVFEKINDEIYYVSTEMKINDLGEINKFDIFCNDIKSFSKKILSVLNNYLTNGYEVTINYNNIYWYFGVIKGNEIVVIFNLYDSLKNYKNTEIKNDLFSSILANRVEQKIFIKKSLIKFYSPKNIDYFIIKYLDYLENNHSRRLNNEYLNYILTKLDNDKNKIDFFYKLNRYTSFNRDLSQNKIYKLIYNLKKRLKNIILIIKCYLKIK